MIDSHIYAGLVLVTAPTEEPISLPDAKIHLRLADEFQVDDDYVTELISLSRKIVETILQRALLTQSWRLSLKSWPGRNYQNWPSQSFSSASFDYGKYNHIELPLPPLQRVESVTYIDTGGVYYVMPQGAQIPSSPPSGNAAISGGYNVFTDFEPGRIVLPFSQIWPTTILLPGAPIQIVFTCGYPDIPTLQASFEGYSASIHAIKMILGYCYENRIPPTEMRKSTVPAGISLVAEEMLEAYRIR